MENHILFNFTSSSKLMFSTLSSLRVYGFVCPRVRMASTDSCQLKGQIHKSFIIPFRFALHLLASGYKDLIELYIVFDYQKVL